VAEPDREVMGEQIGRALVARPRLGKATGCLSEQQKKNQSDINDVVQVKEVDHDVIEVFIEWSNAMRY
jgi:hypothetical protein